VSFFALETRPFKTVATELAEIFAGSYRNHAIFFEFSNAYTCSGVLAFPSLNISLAQYLIEKADIFNSNWSVRVNLSFYQSILFHFLQSGGKYFRIDLFDFKKLVEPFVIAMNHVSYYQHSEFLAYELESVVDRALHHVALHPFNLFLFQQVTLCSLTNDIITYQLIYLPFVT